MKKKLLFQSLASALRLWRSTLARWTLALGMLLLCASAPRAETLLLVHGMMTDGSVWRYSGVSQALQDAGWKDVGDPGTREFSPPVSGRVFCTVTLDSFAPISQQAEALDKHLDTLRKARPGDPITIAGHSAGGVVGRLLMVKHPEAGIAALITIASPHLGADTAALGLWAGQQGPLALLDSWLGTRDFSRLFEQLSPLLTDLAPESSDNLLGWLNHQPHPEAVYISMVRESDNVWEGGDLLVPKLSQDLNQVQALKGRARTVYTPGGHDLSYADGELLAQLLKSLALI